MEGQLCKVYDTGSKHVSPKTYPSKMPSFAHLLHGTCDLLHGTCDPVS